MRRVRLKCANEDGRFFAGDNKPQKSRVAHTKVDSISYKYGLASRGRPGSLLQKNINRILTLLIPDFVYVNYDRRYLHYASTLQCSVLYCTRYSNSAQRHCTAV